MRSSFLQLFLIAVLAALPSSAADDAAVIPTPKTSITCGSSVPGGINCTPTKKDLKQARNAYARGLKLEDGKHFEEAFEQFDQAARLAPQNVQFVSAREVAKSQIVFQHTMRGD